MRAALTFAVAGFFFALGVHAGQAQDSKQVAQGAALYKEHCARCHGEDGRGGEGFATPIWGQGAQIRKFKDGGGLYEYNKLLMPFDNPNAISDQQKLAVIAYILANHELIGRRESIDGNRIRWLKIP
jgi:mono/diheme cytochrome c family protein